jgi:hypothetical protein
VETVIVLDGDKTLAQEDSGVLFWEHILSGDRGPRLRLTVRGYAPRRALRYLPAPGFCPHPVSNLGSLIRDFRTQSERYNKNVAERKMLEILAAGQSFQGTVVLGCA